MSAALPAPKNYLSPADRQRIKAELKQISARRRATSDVAVGAPQYMRPQEVGIDDEILAERELKLKGMLEKDSPPKLTPVQRNAAYREFNTLVREFEDNALTKYDQGLGYPEMMKKLGLDRAQDYELAKKKCAAWELGDRGNYVCHRLKNLAGVLDPDNPDLRNLENFRRRK